VKVGGLDAAVVYRANTTQVAGDLEVVDINHPMAKAVQPYALARNTPHRQTASRLIRAIRGGPARFELAGFRFLPQSPSQ
jgi:ABC-type molybdate transport system substrate-binding protein